MPIEKLLGMLSSAHPRHKHAATAGDRSPMGAVDAIMPTSSHEEEKAAEKELQEPKEVTSANVWTLFVCVSGIYVCYLAYGILQEKMFSTEYPDNDATTDDRFTFVQLLVFFQCCVNALLCQVLQAISFCMDRSTGSNQGKFRLCIDSRDMAVLIAVSSASYVGAMSCSNTALKYVNYPTQALGKSCKMIPVMLFGVVWNKKKHTWAEYIAAVMVSLGIGAFSVFGKTKAHHAAGASSTPLGLGLLFASLCLDGVVGATQDRIVARHNPSSIELMRLINACGAFWLLCSLVVTGEGYAGVVWCMGHLAAVNDMMMFAICSAVGQMFIFLCIRQFGSLVCTTVTTTRKFFTVLASVLWYGHQLKPPQWVAIFVVFGGIGIKLAQSWARRLAGGGGGGGGGKGGGGKGGGGGEPEKPRN